MDVTGAGALFLSAEYAVKAVIASTTVSYPRPLRPTGSSTSRIGSVAPIPTRPAGVPGRHRAPRPQRPLPPRDPPARPATHIRDLGLVVIERGVAEAPGDRATVHSVHRARRDREPGHLRQASLLTEPDPWWFRDRGGRGTDVVR